MDGVGQYIAVCLLSGGLDSATALYVAIQEGFTPVALTVDYGQRHRREIESARRIAKALKIEHQVISAKLPWGGSALLDTSIEVPSHRSTDEMAEAIPATYVPARNTVFLSLAASLAETRGADAIFIGANALDYSGYPDCRPDFFRAFETCIAKGTKRGTEGKKLQVFAPLINLKKSEIVLLAHKLEVPIDWTWSCYRGEQVPCGNCDACILREKGFSEAGLEDAIDIGTKLKQT